MTWIMPISASKRREVLSRRAARDTRPSNLACKIPRSGGGRWRPGSSTYRSRSGSVASWPS